MNIYSNIKKIIIDIVTNINPNIDETILKNISCEKPKNESHGDVSSNVVMLLSKKINLSANELSEIIIAKAKKNKIFDEINFVKPGFINFKLSISIWHELLFEIKKKEYTYGFKNLGKGEKINIEFVSANPTGPIHVAHIRGAVFGDVLSSLYEKVGFNVFREYYVNDAGSQIDKLTNSVYKRYLELFGKKIKLLDDEYPGDYLINIAKEIISKDGDKWISDNSDQSTEYFKNYSINKLISEIKSDLKLLDIKFDIFTHETNIVASKIIDKLFDILRKKNLIYEGVLPKPKTEDVEWEPRKQLLFRSSDIYDDQDRAFKKSNGDWTYFANDAAYHFDKYQRKC